MGTPLDRALYTWMADYVDTHRFPGALTLVAVDGVVESLVGCGLRDVEAGTPITDDTIFRIYSMSKPVTTVAAMSLIDDGLLGLDDPVSAYIPSFGDLVVNAGGAGDHIRPVPGLRPMTIRHLLTHTSGLTYGEGNPGAVARLYEERRTDFGTDDGTLSEVVDRLATIPLLFEPGSQWNYGVSTDVLGRVVEVAANAALDEVIRHRITEPLGMSDTCFAIHATQRHRLASLYGPSGDGTLELLESGDQSPEQGTVQTFSGGAGLLSTIEDYRRFAQMLLNGGLWEGSWVLSPDAASQMTTNQIPGDLSSFGSATFNETTTAGIGFGFGGSVVVDPGTSAWASSLGEYAWGGYASTAFWIDPVHDLLVVFMTQLIPSDRYPIRGELRQLVNEHRPARRVAR